MKHILILIILSSCASVTEEVITIQKKDLIPEGIAIGPEGEIYLSNLYTKNIVKAKRDGLNPEEVRTSYSGTYSGVGITVNEDKIFALGNNEKNGFNSVFQIIDLTSKQLTKSYELTDTAFSFFNDLIVSGTGKVFITNTGTHSIHTVENDSLVDFLQSEEIEYPNGIAISDDNSKLYIAAFRKGIRIFDLEKKVFVNEEDTSGLTGGIDGMKFFNNSLIAIQNASRNREDHCIVRFYLDKEGTAVIEADTLFRNHDTFNIPTTLDIRNGWVYVLANSQMENLDQETMKLIRPEELTSTFVLKFKPD